MDLQLFHKPDRNYSFHGPIVTELRRRSNLMPLKSFLLDCHTYFYTPFSLVNQFKADMTWNASSLIPDTFASLRSLPQTFLPKNCYQWKTSNSFLYFLEISEYCSCQISSDLTLCKNVMWGSTEQHKLPHRNWDNSLHLPGASFLKWLLKFLSMVALTNIFDFFSFFPQISCLCNSFLAEQLISPFPSWDLTQQKYSSFLNSQQSSFPVLLTKQFQSAN